MNSLTFRIRCRRGKIYEAAGPIADPLAARDLTDSLPAAGTGTVDIGLLLKEIERRVAGIETRIDELGDGRERIERQVAAQTEELRVQRAAIARTQRAVRNMSRPADEAGPTEPALREPTTS